MPPFLFHNPSRSVVSAVSLTARSQIQTSGSIWLPVNWQHWAYDGLRHAIYSPLISFLTCPLSYRNVFIHTNLYSGMTTLHRITQYIIGLCSYSIWDSICSQAVLEVICRKPLSGSCPSILSSCVESQYLSLPSLFNRQREINSWQLIRKKTKTQRKK